MVILNQRVVFAFFWLLRLFRTFHFIAAHGFLARDLALKIRPDAGLGVSPIQHEAHMQPGSDLLMVGIECEVALECMTRPGCTIAIEPNGIDIKTL